MGLRPAWLLVGYVALIACSSDGDSSNDSTPAGDPSTEGMPGADDSGSTDTVKEAGNTDGGGSDDGGGGLPFCSGRLINESKSVVVNYDAASAPTPAGGTIADGTYVLTDVTVYGVASGNQELRQGTTQFSSGFVEQAFTQGAWPKSTVDVDAQNNTVTFTPVCKFGEPPDAPRTFGYTATPSTFVTFNEFTSSSTRTRVWTYTKK